MASLAGSVLFCESAPLLIQELLDDSECLAAMTDRVFGLGRHLCEGLIEALWLKNGVPAEGIVASWRNNRALAAAREDDRLSVGALAEGEDALRIRTFVFKVLHHFPEAVCAHSAQEILTARTQIIRLVKNFLLHLHIGAWEAVVGIEAEANILGEHRRVALGRCQLYLVSGDLLWGALNLEQVHAHVRDGVGVCESSSHYFSELLELLCIASDESDWDLGLRHLFFFVLILLFFYWL